MSGTAPISTELMPVNQDYCYTLEQWQAVEEVLLKAKVIPEWVAPGSREDTPVWTRRPTFPRNVAALHADLDVELHILGSYGAVPHAPGRLAARYERFAKRLAVMRRDLSADPLLTRNLPDLAELEAMLVSRAASLKRHSRGRPRIATQRLEFCLALLRLWHFGFDREVTTSEDSELINFMRAAAAPAGRDYPLTDRACQDFIGEHRHLLDRLDRDEYIQLQGLF